MLPKEVYQIKPIDETWLVAKKYKRAQYGRMATAFITQIGC